MKTLWAPWRIDYILSEKDKGCVLCEAPKRHDELIVCTGSTCYAIMNRYPYTTGHTMITPYRHVSDICELTGEESSEMMALAGRIVKACRESLKPDGFNLGFNLGEVAGAGIADHLHLHVVPRWKGDTNFMPVLGDVRIISEHILKTKARIKERLS